MEYGDEMPEQHPPADAALAELAAREEGATRQHLPAHAPDPGDRARRRARQRLRALTDWRAKPAVPFGGKFRIIDFTLSNCVNSGIRRIGVATQYKAQSLIRHVQRGWAFLDGRIERVRRPAAGAAARPTDVVPGHRRRGVPEPRHPAPPRAGVRARPGRRPRLQDGLRQACSPTTSRAGADMTVACIEVPLEEARALRRDGRRRGCARQSLSWRSRRSPPPMPGPPGPRARQHGHLRVQRAASSTSSSSATPTTRGSSHDFGKDIIPHLVGARLSRVRARLPATAAST